MRTLFVVAFTARFLAWNDYAVLACYFALNLGIGWWWSRRRQSTGGFFLGNRRLGWAVAAVSFFATNTSSISFMALPATSYQGNWLSFGSVPAQVLGGLVVGLFLVRVLRRMNITTIYAYLGKRFDQRVQLLGAGLGALLKVGARLSVVMLLPSLALSTVTGLNVYFSILLMGVVTTMYAMAGGFEAVIWTQVAQVIVTYGGVALALGYLASGVEGGIGGIFHLANQADKFHLVSWAPDLTQPTVWVFIGMFFGHIFTTFADQPAMQGILATANEKEGRRAVVIGKVFGLTSSLCFFFVGTSLYVFYRIHPDRLVKALPNDAIFPYFIANELPRGVVGLVVAGLFAAAMGALSSAMNATAAIVVSDFQTILRPNSTEAQRLRVARIATLVCGALSTAMASYLAFREIPSLWEEFMRLVALLGGGVPGIFALGVLTRRAHSTGVIIGTLSSVAVTWWVQHYTNVSVFLHGFVAIGSCTVIGYVASLLIPTPKAVIGVAPPAQRFVGGG